MTIKSLLDFIKENNIPEDAAIDIPCYAGHAPICGDGCCVEGADTFIEVSWIAND